MDYNLRLVWIEFIFTKIKNWNWKYYSKIIFKCVNSIVWPIFNEKLLKNEIYGSMNSAWVYCSRLTWSNSTAEKKKKEKKKSENANTTIYNLNPNTHLVPLINNKC